MLRAILAAVVLLAGGAGLAGCDDVGAARLPAGVAWPPAAGQPFPDVEWTNYDGRKFRISDFRGKAVLVEPVGMTCEACNAFSGGREYGGVGPVTPQADLDAIETYLPDYADGVRMGDPDLVFVQLVLYDLAMGPPKAEDARLWAEHFGLDGRDNVYVAFSAVDLRGNASFRMIPGFYLVDKASTVRYDAAGHRPLHNLYTQLLPAIPRLLSE